MTDCAKMDCEKEAAMVYQDFFFLMLMVIFLYFAKREAGHWKH